MPNRRAILVSLVATLLSTSLGAAPAKPAYPLTMHVFACTVERPGLDALEVLVASVAGQPFVLGSIVATPPLMPGDYPATVLTDAQPHGSEMNRRYALRLADGTKLNFDVIGTCAKDSTVCHGVSITSTP